MSNESESASEPAAETEPPESVEIAIDRGRAYHYEALVEEFGADLVDNQLEQLVNDELTKMFDQRDQIRQQLQQAKQQR